ncbi:MAG: hypothetical protein RQM95_13725 [Syntrophaceticus schinkii]
MRAVLEAAGIQDILTSPGFLQCP